MRAEGYYWTKYQGNWIISEWRKLILYGHKWFIEDRVFDDEDFDEIDERQIVREKQIFDKNEGN